MAGYTVIQPDSAEFCCDREPHGALHVALGLLGSFQEEAGVCLIRTDQL